MKHQIVKPLLPGFSDFPANLSNVDMTILLAYFMTMIIANIAEFKNRISELVSAVERGEEIELRKRNVPIARVVPVEKTLGNTTTLGCGRETGRILGDIVRPFMPQKDWEMLREKDS